MKYLSLITCLLLSISSANAQITKELLNQIPELSLNKAYSDKEFLEFSNKHQQKVTLDYQVDKLETLYVIGKLKNQNTHYLITADEYYKSDSKNIDNIMLHKYNPSDLEWVDNEPLYFYLNHIVHEPQYSKLQRSILFASDQITLNNETTSFRLVSTYRYKDSDLYKQEAFINLSHFQEFPVGKNIDVKEMNSLLEKSKEETFCNIDGYCQFDVVGKIITPKKAIIVTSDIYSSLQDESDQYMSVGVLTLPNQTGWIKVKYWVPATYDDVKSIRISSDKKYLYMKDNAGKETKEKL